MIDEMVERVARAILKEERNLDLELSSDITKQSYCRYARAAIEAMREPTEAMLAAGDKKQDFYSGFIWQAMIDAALDGKVAKVIRGDLGADADDICAGSAAAHRQRGGS